MSSYSDSSSGEEDEDEDAIVVLLREKLVDHDPQTYVNLILNLRKFGRLSELRKARETYHKLFLCTPGMWEQWLQDEMDVITDNEKKKDLLNMYKRATEGYYSFDLNMQRVQFEYDLMKSGDFEGNSFWLNINYFLQIIW